MVYEAYCSSNQFFSVFCELNFGFTPMYPHEELPSVEIETETLDEQRVDELNQLMTSLVWHNKHLYSQTYMAI